MHVTSTPTSAKPAPVTSPTYPVPTMAMCMQISAPRMYALFLPLRSPLSRIAVVGVVGVVVVALVCGRAAADEGRYQDYPSGARAASLGGAFCALADDASGVFYNPA